MPHAARPSALVKSQLHRGFGPGRIASNAAAVTAAVTATAGTDHARNLAIQRPDLLVDPLADRVRRARPIVGEMGMKTLHPFPRAADAATWSMRCIAWHQRVPFRSVSLVGSAQRLGELGLLCRPPLSVAHATSRLESCDTPMRERARQPVARWKRLASVEYWRNLGDDRKTKMTAHDDTRGGSKRAPNLRRKDICLACIHNRAVPAEGRRRNRLTTIARSSHLAANQVADLAPVVRLADDLDDHDRLGGCAVLAQAELA